MKIAVVLKGSHHLKGILKGENSDIYTVINKKTETADKGIHMSNTNAEQNVLICVLRICPFLGIMVAGR